MMKTGPRYLTLAGIALLIAAASAFAQKIKVKSVYDKSNDFARYKRYNVGKNFLLTHQTQEVQARINRLLLASLRSHLQAKGFILDETSPDFVITYEAGSFTQADVSRQPDIYYGVPPDNPAFGEIGIEGIPAEVWTYTLARLKLTVTDVGSGKPVWTVRASEKIRNGDGVLNDLYRAS